MRVASHPQAMPLVSAGKARGLILTMPVGAHSSRVRGRVPFPYPHPGLPSACHIPLVVGATYGSVMDVTRRLTPDEEARMLCSFLRNGTALTLRTLAGLSTDELAERIGVSAEVVATWESGEVYPEQPYEVRKYMAVLRDLCLTPMACS